MLVPIKDHFFSHSISRYTPSTSPALTRYGLPTLVLLIPSAKFLCVLLSALISKLSIPVFDMSFITSTSLLLAPELYLPSSTISSQISISEYTSMFRQDPTNYTATSASTGFASLQTRIQGLAQELQEMILEELIVTSLKPGKIFSASKLSHGYARPYLDILLALNHRMLPNAKHLLYSENTFVVSEGGVRTIKFLQKMHDSNRRLIKSVEIAFTYADNSLRFPEDFTTYMSRQTKRAERRREPISQESIKSQYIVHCRQSLDDVQQVWHTKFKAVSALRLNTLSLDFRGIYAWDTFPSWGGETYTRDLICSLGFQSFKHGLPAKLDIIAPTPDDEEYIQLTLWAYNPMGREDVPGEPQSRHASQWYRGYLGYMA